MFNDLRTGIWSYFAVLYQLNKKAIRGLMLVIALLSVLWASGVFYVCSVVVHRGIEWGIERFDWLESTYTIHVVSEVVAAIFVFVLSIFVFRYTLYIVLSPLMSRMSYLVEKQLYVDVGAPAPKLYEPGLWKSFSRALKLNVRNFIAEIAWMILFFLLSLFPVIGIVGVFGLILVQAGYAGYANLDFTLERHKDYAGSKTYVKHHPGLIVANGLVFVALMAIPLVGWIVAPLWSVMAATHSFTKNHKVWSPD